jgi:hypothetical protein
VKIEQVYGPGEKLTKAYPSVILQLLNNCESIALTNGLQFRDFIFIDDVVSAVIHISSNLRFGLRPMDQDILDSKADCRWLFDRGWKCETSIHDGFVRSVRDVQLRLVS